MDLLVLLTWLAAIITATCAAAALLLYVVPVRSVVAIRVPEGPAEVAVMVSFGPAGIRITHGGAARRVEFLGCSRVLYATMLAQPDNETGTPTAAPEEPSGEQTPGRAMEHPPIMKVVSCAANLAAPVLRFCTAVLRLSRFDGMTGTIVAGFENPADTGTWYGWYWACRFFLEELKIRIEVEPVFDREVFSCDLEVAFSLHHPLLVILATARLLLEPPVRECIGMLRTTAPAGSAA
jgi:hypothetical protein